MHSLIRHVPLLIVVALTSGCLTSNLYLESSARQLKPKRGEEMVYVSNPELQPEFDILRTSGIYAITDRTNDAANLTLKPLAHGGGCGLGLILTAYTLGAIPASLPGRLTFNYEIEQAGTANSYAHILPVYERFSLWELFFKPFKSERRVLAKALAQSERAGPLKAGSFPVGGIMFSPPEPERQ